MTKWLYAHPTLNTTHWWHHTKEDSEATGQTQCKRLAWSISNVCHRPGNREWCRVCYLFTIPGLDGVQTTYCKLKESTLLITKLFSSHPSQRFTRILCRSWDHHHHHHQIYPNFTDKENKCREMKCFSKDHKMIKSGAERRAEPCPWTSIYSSHPWKRQTRVLPLAGQPMHVAVQKAAVYKASPLPSHWLCTPFREAKL